MAFPSSPTNGQTTTINNVTYVYDGTAWSKQGAVSTASAVSSVAGRTGAVTLTAADIAAGTFPGALTAGSTLSVSGVLSAASGTASSSTTTGALVVTGGLGVSGTIYAGGLSIAAINSTPIGSTTASTGAFTTLTASGSTQISSLGVGTAASGTGGEIRATNAITAYYSDERLKTVTGKIENALDKIDQLTGILYTQNKLAESFGYNNYEPQVGLKAQDVQRVQPEAVKPAPFDIAEDGSSRSGQRYLTIQYEKLVPLLIEGIKELRQEINEIKRKQ